MKRQQKDNPSKPPTARGAPRENWADRNWLAELDAKAAQLPRATKWLYQYPYFIFARYPQLRPKPVKGNKRSEMDCEVGSSALRDTVWEISVQLYEKAPRAFKDLDPRQQYQLAALVVDTIASLEERQLYQTENKRLGKVRSEFSRRTRMMNRKYEKAVRDLKALHDYANRLDRMLGGYVKHAAIASLEPLSKIAPLRTQESIPSPNVNRPPRCWRNSSNPSNRCRVSSRLE